MFNIGLLMQAVKDTIIPEVDGGYTILIIIQFCLELALFLVAVITVTWPKRSLIRDPDVIAKANVSAVNRIHYANQAQTAEVSGLPCLTGRCFDNQPTDWRTCSLCVFFVFITFCAPVRVLCRRMNMMD